MRRTLVRLVLAIVMALAARQTVVRADPCDWWWSTGYQGWQQLHYSCGSTDCLTCYNARHQCVSDCQDVYDPATQHDEFNWCVQGCVQSSTECYQSCTYR
jgi:hypothetical protein